MQIALDRQRDCSAALVREAAASGRASAMSTSSEQIDTDNGNLRCGRTD
ncbi:MAG TPA: hypothetical protein VFU81_06220 [Thermomicrobiales bacterium]|nr:hypothetical protein [Thermomicrobiales bacterium]